jgi:hypothetical protein
MNRLKSILLILIIISSCQTRDEFPDISNQIDFEYKQLKYSREVSSENLKGIHFFSKDSSLIEKVGYEYRMKLIYDNQNNLIETHNCRMYNCNLSSRKFYFYDKSNNLIGSSSTYKFNSKVHRDTIKFEQTKFYNLENQIEKELIFRGNGYETWKNYEYSENRIIREVEIQNYDTIWIGNYFYDKNNNLIQISRRFKEKYEIELFFYNKFNKIAEHRIMSNENKVGKYTSHSSNNNSTEYKYYENGLIKEKTHYNHLAEERWKYIYKYEKKKY